MPKKFLSFLGTGNYEECIYKCRNTNIKTRFIQKALIEDMCKTWSDEDEVIIFLTEKSKKVNWEDRYSNDGNIDKEGLKSEIEKIFGKCNVQIKEKIIPEGRNLDEIWQIFEIMMQSISKGDEVIFDITHSFRSLPMLALVVLNYAKVIKDISILGIYYGAYEAKDENSIAPVFDLKEFDRLLEWSYAINSFVKFGNSRQIFELVNKEKKQDINYRDVANFASRLNDFTSTILTCRGMNREDKQKSVQESYCEMIKELNKVKERNIIPQLKHLFELVQSRTESFNKTDNLSTGIAFIKWCIDNKLVQQGYTALDETIKTYICKINGLDETNYDNREDICGKACVVFAKNEDEWRVKTEENKEKIKKVIENTPRKLLDLAQEVRDARNDINHLGFRSDSKSYSSLEKDLKKSYEKFLEIINDNKLEI